MTQPPTKKDAPKGASSPSPTPPPQPGPTPSRASTSSPTPPTPDASPAKAVPAGEAGRREDTSAGEARSSIVDRYRRLESGVETPPAGVDLHDVLGDLWRQMSRKQRRAEKERAIRLAPAKDAHTREQNPTTCSAHRPWPTVRRPPNVVEMARRSLVASVRAGPKFHPTTVSVLDALGTGFVELRDQRPRGPASLASSDYLAAVLAVSDAMAGPITNPTQARGVAQLIDSAFVAYDVAGPMSPDPHVLRWLQRVEAYLGAMSWSMCALLPEGQGGDHTEPPCSANASEQGVPWGDEPETKGGRPPTLTSLLHSLDGLIAEATWARDVVLEGGVPDSVDLGHMSVEVLLRCSDARVGNSPAAKNETVDPVGGQVQWGLDGDPNVGRRGPYRFRLDCETGVDCSVWIYGQSGGEDQFCNAKGHPYSFRSRAEAKRACENWGRFRVAKPEPPSCANSWDRGVRWGLQADDEDYAVGLRGEYTFSVHDMSWDGSQGEWGASVRRPESNSADTIRNKTNGSACFPTRELARQACEQWDDRNSGGPSHPTATTSESPKVEED